jgi:hypothetical protein
MVKTVLLHAAVKVYAIGYDNDRFVACEVKGVVSKIMALKNKITFMISTLRLRFQYVSQNDNTSFGFQFNRDVSLVSTHCDNGDSAYGAWYWTLT